LDYLAKQGRNCSIAQYKMQKRVSNNFSSKFKMDQLRKDLKETSKKLCDVTNKCELLEVCNKELLAISEPSRKRKCVKS